MEAIEKSNKVVIDYRDNFTPPDYINSFNTFSNLIWQIVVNEIYKNEKVCFYVDVMSEKNSLIVAFEIGGYKKTGVNFIQDNFNFCIDLCDKLNEEVFGLSKEETVKLVNTSMFHNQLLE